MKNLLKQYSVNQNQSIGEVTNYFIQYKVQGVAVCDNDNNLVGFITVKDIFRSIYDNKYHNMPDGFVRDYMEKNVRTLPKDLSANDLINKFVEHPFHYYPTIDNNGKFCGTFYREDVFTQISLMASSTW